MNIPLIDLYWIPVPIRELTFDSRQYLGIIIRFPTFHVNQLEIHNPICESTKDSCPYIEINTGFHALEGNHYSNINMNHINF